MRARFNGDTAGTHFPALGPYLLSPGDVIDFANHPDADPDAFVGRDDFELLADDDAAETTVLARGDEHPIYEPAVAEPTLAEKIAGATTHASLHAVAAELGFEVPDDVKAAWGDAVRVDEKRALLEQRAAEISGDQGADVTEEASAGTD